MVISTLAGVAVGGIVTYFVTDIHEQRRVKRRRKSAARIFRQDVLSSCDRMRQYEKTEDQHKSGSLSLGPFDEQVHNFEIYTTLTKDIGLFENRTIEKLMQFYNLLQRAEENRRLKNMAMQDIPDPSIARVFRRMRPLTYKAECQKILKEALQISEKVLELLETEEC